MSKAVEKCLPFLKLLINTYKESAVVARNILQSATRHQIACIAELFVNVLLGNIAIPEEVKECLGKSKSILRKIRHFAVEKDEEMLRLLYIKHYKSVIKCISSCIPYLEEKINNGKENSDNKSAS